MADRPVTSLLFYGYSPLMLSEWCAITEAHAKRLKQASSLPSAPVRRLFELHRDKQVLTPAFHGFRVAGDRIFDPEGNGTTANQLRAYAILMQWAAELARSSESTRAQFDNILRLADG